jgi:hypothetical protein
MTIDLKAEAAARHELHKDHPTHRPLSDDYELVGLRGEEKLSRVFGVPMDMMRRPNGDGGIDNVLRLNVRDGCQDFVVDVKTAKIPRHLLVEVGKVRPRTIYILAGYSGDAADLLGWQWGRVVLQAPTGDFGYGVVSHFIPAGELRKIEELLSRHRAGFVGYDDEGHFLHYCQCGAWATNSEQTALLKDRPGKWWCHQCYKEMQHERQEERARRSNDEVGAGASAP